jgi:WD40 repeat protein
MQAARGLVSLVFCLVIGFGPLLLGAFLFSPNFPGVATVAFGPDGATLVTAIDTFGDVEYSHEIRVYELATGRERREARKGFHPLPLRTATAVRRIEAQWGRRPIPLAEIAEWPYRVVCDGTPASGAAVFRPDGRVLATLAPKDREPYRTGGPVHLWDVATGTVLKTLDVGDSSAAFAFSADGRTFASVPTEEPMLGPEPEAGELARLVACGIVAYDVAAGRVRTPPWKAKPMPGLPPVALAPDGVRVAARGAKGWLNVWEIDDGRLVGRVPGLVAEAVAFAPDGRRLAVAGSEAVEVWEIDPWRRVSRFTGHAQPWLVTARKWFEAHLPDEGSGPYRNFIHALAFSPGGRSVASGDSNGDVRVWDATTGRERRLFRHRYERADEDNEWSAATAIAWLWACGWAFVGVVGFRSRRNATVRAGTQRVPDNIVL